ncbi:hypothetical protein J8F10_21950 [Gemmata sp. G18]|uniref:DUF3168 domain-containing protein n=1 Tax=Gemmata palustris TaxID=2822762 RepID=A0ABS5BW60_9BACT|nr:hypothetical protein [Gemmata palustris]MBP3957926.1 hypothetical protein [Gemmata palustris]
MDVFRFIKLTQKANDPARRYTIVTGQGIRVGDVEVTPPARDAVVLDLVLYPTLSDAAREDALNTTRRFLDELALGWGVHLNEGAGAREEEQPDGKFRVRLEYRAT